MAIGPGSDLAGYHLQRMVGEGGMAEVFLAERSDDGRQAALKVLRKELSEDDDFRSRFLREAGYAQSLHHPNIVPVQESGEAGGRLFIAWDYVQGTDLYTLLEAGPLDPELTITILKQVAAGLDAAHADGLLHRDVKPANVLVAAGGGRRPKCFLTDFGLSKHSTRDSRALTNAGDFVGTIQYTAPEQILGKYTDQRVDVYSLGCLLYECLVGTSPFGDQEEMQVMQSHVESEPPPPSAAAGHLPPELDSVVSKALAKDPADRYASCGELMAAAEAALGGSEPPADTAESAGAASTAGAAPGALKLQVTGGNATGTEIEVGADLEIGREADGSGRLGGDAQISRRHARISRTPDGGFTIEDLGSTNGTFLNGRQISVTEPLSNGDTIEVGDTTLVASLAPPEAGLAPARLSVHLEIDLDAGEATIEIEGAPVRLVRDGDRWVPAP
jgi:tRNA A-37 threonylcarbamoyl transferase component Bud32